MILRYTGGIMARVIAMGIIVALCAAVGAAYAAGDVKALYEEKCSMCHDIDRSSSIKMTEAGWRETVIRMKNENGCPLTSEETEAIIKYLVENRGKK